MGWTRKTKKYKMIKLIFKFKWKKSKKISNNPKMKQIS